MTLKSIPHQNHPNLSGRKRKPCASTQDEQGPESYESRRMRSSSQRFLNALILSCCGAALFLSLGVNQLAQTTQKVPATIGHVNDLAGVVNEQTKQQLENILTNLKLKTEIEFDVATVQSTWGQDISEF